MIYLAEPGWGRRYVAPKTGDEEELVEADRRMRLTWPFMGAVQIVQPGDLAWESIEKCHAGTCDHWNPLAGVMDSGRWTNMDRPAFVLR